MCKQSKYNSLIGVLEHFSDEKVCLQHLEGLRWPNREPTCPHCDNEKVYRFKDGKRFKCAKCRKQFTAKVGTIFEGSNLPLSKWFAAIYLATSHKKGISSHQLAKDLEISQKSAWHVLHRIREMVKSTAPYMLKGTVELDESYVGGKASNWHARKRKAMREAGTGYIHKTPVFAILQRSDGKVFTQVVSRTDGLTLKPIIRKHVEKGSLMLTDTFGAYKDLDKEGYRHEKLNHLRGEYVRGDDIHTNTIEGFFSLLKRGLIGIYHHVEAKHLHRYCDEFAFRYGTRKATEAQRFDLAISQSDGRRLKWDDLTARSK